MPDNQKIVERLLKEYPRRSPEEQMPIFQRGAAELLPSPEEYKARLRENRPLRIKLGVDPTSADLHLGHTVPLQKLKQLQELGHQVDFLIGNYTALIGDPSGRSKTRPRLTEEEVAQNARTYTEQVFKILDPDKTVVRHNGEWLAPLNYKDIVELCSRVTVARMIERDDFAKRYKEGTPIFLHELLYPVMQAFDSVNLDSDVELGGTDQRFNLLVGRDFLEQEGKPGQLLLLMPILPGTDGHEKMSKSLGNAIGINEPAFTIFAKTMSIPDGLIIQWFELLTDISQETLDKYKQDYKDAGDPQKTEIELGPLSRSLLRPSEGRMGLKMELARQLAIKYAGKDAGEDAYDRWKREKQERALPDLKDLTPLVLEDRDLAQDGMINLVDLIDRAKLPDKSGQPLSRSEIRRKIKERAIRLNGEQVSDPQLLVKPETGMIIQFGRQQAFRVERK